MGYSVEILADSLNPSGARLTTFELIYPRFVHSEFMTHRMFSRNAASSRAIPIEKMIARVEEDPVLPVWWGKTQRGMVAEEEVSESASRSARESWLIARDLAILQARDLLALGVHKQLVNRLLEPWTWITVICSATSYENFFALRTAPDAQPELRHLALLMLDAYRGSTPVSAPAGYWHLPLVSAEERQNVPIDDLIKVSAGRCARVSYLTHAGKRDLEADLALHDRLIRDGHVSPLEHQAQATDGRVAFGNFVGWWQYRKMLDGEVRSFVYGE